MNPERLAVKSGVMPVVTFELKDNRRLEDRQTKEYSNENMREKVFGDELISPSPVRLLETELAKQGGTSLSGRKLTVVSLQVSATVRSPTVDARETYSAAGVGPAGPALAGALIYGFRLAKTRPSMYVRVTIVEDNREYLASSRADVRFGGDVSDALSTAIANVAKEILDRIKSADTELK